MKELSEEQLKRRKFLMARLRQEGHANTIVEEFKRFNVDGKPAPKYVPNYFSPLC